MQQTAYQDYTTPTPYRPANQEIIQKLAPIANTLAYKAGYDGITVSDVRMEAYRLNIFDGTERGRDLSFLGAVMAAAGLAKTGELRRSKLAVTHGIRQVVWMHRAFDA